MVGRFVAVLLSFMSAVGSIPEDVPCSIQPVIQLQIMRQVKDIANITPFKMRFFTAITFDKQSVKPKKIRGISNEITTIKDKK